MASPQDALCRDLTAGLSSALPGRLLARPGGPERPGKQLISAGW